MELVTIQDIFDLRYVRFNVGGYLYATTKDTIMRFPESVIAKMISPEFDKRQTNQQYIYIDRDGKHFGTILDYMRDASSVDLSRFGVNDQEELAGAAHYYNLESLFEIASGYLRNPVDVHPDVFKGLALVKYVLNDKNLAATIETRGKISLLLRERGLQKLNGWRKLWSSVHHDDVDIYLLTESCSRLLANRPNIYAGLYCPRTRGLIEVVRFFDPKDEDIPASIYKLLLSARTHFADDCPNEKLEPRVRLYDYKHEVSMTICVTIIGLLILGAILLLINYAWIRWLTGIVVVGVVLICCWACNKGILLPFSFLMLQDVTQVINKRDM